MKVYVKIYFMVFKRFSTLRPPFMLFYGNGNETSERLFQELEQARYAVKRVAEWKSDTPEVLAGCCFYVGVEEIRKKFLS